MLVNVTRATAPGVVAPTVDVGATVRPTVEVGAAVAITIAIAIAIAAWVRSTVLASWRAWGIRDRRGCDEEGEEQGEAAHDEPPRLSASIRCIT